MPRDLEGRASAHFSRGLRFLSCGVMVEVFTLLACVTGALGATVGGPEEPVEEIGLVSALVMLGFLLIAALVVVSFLCKIVIALGFVPKSRASRLHRIIAFLAGATGDLRIVTSTRAPGGGSQTRRGGGGSAGGAGASGDL